MFSFTQPFGVHETKKKQIKNRHMKQLSFILILFCSGLYFSCGVKDKNQNNNLQKFRALAKFVSREGGNKVQISKYVIIKGFSEFTFEGDTISVGYYFNKENNIKFDTVLLTLNKYSEVTKIKNYFICPDFDANTGIQKAKIQYIESAYWEGCETGKGECKPLTFKRSPGEKNWFLIMPCGGTQTSITIKGTDNSYKKELNLFHNNCPPFIELTDMTDGKYSANMLSCGLGGTIYFVLKTI